MVFAESCGKPCAGANTLYISKKSELKIMGTTCCPGCQEKGLFKSAVSHPGLAPMRAECCGLCRAIHSATPAAKLSQVPFGTVVEVTCYLIKLLRAADIQACPTGQRWVHPARRPDGIAGRAMVGPLYAALWPVASTYRESKNQDLISRCRVGFRGGGGR